MTRTTDNQTLSTRARSARSTFPLFHPRAERAFHFSTPRAERAVAPARRSRAFHSARSARGFTLVEILVVVCVITVLVGLTANAAFSARQRGYVSQATTEAEQLCAALKTYRLADRNGKLPFDTKGAWTPATRDLIADLIGEGDAEDTGNAVLLDIAEDRFESVNGTLSYCDPWGNPYEIRTLDPSSDQGSGEAGEGEAGNIVLDETFEVVVSFANQFGRADEF